MWQDYIESDILLANKNVLRRGFMLKRVVTLALFLVSTISFSADFIAGQDYEIMPGSTSAPKAQARAEVIEFFSFGCPFT